MESKRAKLYGRDKSFTKWSGIIEGRNKLRTGKIWNVCQKKYWQYKWT
jgi:hypothetical protein